MAIDLQHRYGLIERQLERMLHWAFCGEDIYGPFIGRQMPELMFYD